MAKTSSYMPNVKGFGRTGDPNELISEKGRKEEIAENRKILKDNPKTGKIKGILKGIGYGLLGGQKEFAEEETLKEKKRRDAKGRLRQLKSRGELRG